MNEGTAAHPPADGGALETASLILTLLALSDLAARSLLRAVVDLYWHQNIHRYDGALLKWVSVGSFFLAVICLGVRHLYPRATRTDTAMLRQGLILLVASNVGFIVAAVCQAMFHIAGLTGSRGGLLHPRSLTLTASAAAVAGSALLIRAVAGKSRRRATHKR